MNSTQKKDKSLFGRKMYIPRMSFGAAKLMSAAWQSVNIQAMPSPPSDALTMELGGKYLNGDECLPERVTLGNFMKVIEDPNFDQDSTAFLMPTASGPCRFGQYQSLFSKILRDRGLDRAMVVAPTSSDGYNGFGVSKTLLRTSWHAIVCGDIIRKMQLKTRPYEKVKGSTNEVFQKSLDELSDILALQNTKHGLRLKMLRKALIKIRDRYRNIPAIYTKDKPLIGLVGEIYCRLNEFSNEYLINKIEEFGGEAWMTDISEWLWYTTDLQVKGLIRNGKRFSKEMLAARVKKIILRRDEEYLLAPFREDFLGYEEPHTIDEVLDHSEPYLTRKGAIGEMVLNVGKSIYLYEKGADGIIDISPFTCMNGIVCETVYPQVSKKFDNFPIRIFYFDGTQVDLDRDVGIFLELAMNYMRKKNKKRVYPMNFI